MDLWSIQAIDHHAHNLLRPELLEPGLYPSAFTESTDPLLIRNHARHTLFFRRSLRDIAELLECEPSVEAILRRRMELGFTELCSRCFRASRLEAAFLDDGFLPEKILPLPWHEPFLPVRRILRLEHQAETLIEREEAFDAFIECFLAGIDPPPEGVVAFKTIAAYRTGLEISSPSEATAKKSFEKLKRHWDSNPHRLSNKALIDYLLGLSLDVASKHAIPVQFHTGFGDSDLDLRLSNPLHLRPLLEEKRWLRVPFVLLHASYPFTREAGYLASVYSQVHLDFGLAVPFLGTAGMRGLLRQLVELAPVSKLMFSSDAHAIPELYYLGAKWGRKSLAAVLEDTIRDGDLTASEAEWAAERILAENARELYLWT